jgi:hypothetical protein
LIECIILLKAQVRDFKKQFFDEFQLSSNLFCFDRKDSKLLLEFIKIDAMFAVASSPIRHNAVHESRLLQGDKNTNPITQVTETKTMQFGTHRKVDVTKVVVGQRTRMRRIELARNRRPIDLHFAQQTSKCGSRVVMCFANSPATCRCARTASRRTPAPSAQSAARATSARRKHSLSLNKQPTVVVVRLSFA